MRRFLAVGLSALLASPPAESPPFLDATASSQIGFVFAPSKTASKYLIEAMGGGVAAFDADGDGKLDLFFTNGASLREGMTADSRADKSEPRYWNRLYRNRGDGTFADITEKAGVRGDGYGQGIAVGDCNNDGRTDLYVTALGGNSLYVNRAAGVFEDTTVVSGAKGGGWSTSAGFIDNDRDGWLDLLVVRYLDWDFGKNKRCGGAGPELRAYCHPNEFRPGTHLLYRNLGGCRFEDVSVRSGIAKAPGKGLGVAFQDVDRDGWPDILVANDSFPQQLFRNRRDGTFEEIALSAGIAYDDDGKVFAGMGADLADYDNDGWPDAFLNALANQGYAIFHNAGGLFSYASAATGMAAITRLHSGWGARFFDYDNDGWKDLFVAQGHVMDNIERTQPGIRYREKPLLLRNRGNGQFGTVSAEAFQTPLAGRGAAFGDLDNDGAVDVVVSSIEGGPKIFHNTSGANRWLIVNTTGVRSNRDGIGASVRITGESGREQYGFVSATGSYLSAHDKRVHFGLGRDRLVKSIEIRWPSGIVQRWKNVAANQIFEAKESEERR